MPATGAADNTYLAKKSARKQNHTGTLRVYKLVWWIYAIANLAKDAISASKKQIYVSSMNNRETRCRGQLLLIKSLNAL